MSSSLFKHQVGSRRPSWLVLSGVWVVLLAWLSPGVVDAADVTIASNTTYGSNQTIDTLTVNSGVTLTLTGSAQVSVTNLSLPSTNSRIVFASSAARLNVSGTATLSGSSARIEASGANLITLRGGTWNLSGPSARIEGNLDMDVANLTIGASAYITATGYGEAQNAGVGAGFANNSSYSSGSGASHGGVGLTAYNQGNVRAYYGSALNPTGVGSGGGSSWGASGGSGGGILKVVVGGVFQLDGNLQSSGNNGATSNQHSYYGAGGGSGGTVTVTTNVLRGGGTFYANGGSGGGGHNSYRGGGGGGGRVIVNVRDRSGFTRPFSSQVQGGVGYGGGDAGSGTLAFVEMGSDLGSRADDKLLAVMGWRWQSGDAPFQMASFEAYNSTEVIGPDASAVVLEFSDKVHLQPSARWRPNTHNALLVTDKLLMESTSLIHAGSMNFNAQVATTLRMEVTSQINAVALTVTGTSLATLNSTANFNAQRINYTGRDLTLSTSASFNVSARGQAQNVGTGRGTANGSAYSSGSGAGHGGVGQSAYNTGGFGAFYALTKGPTELGSGGGSSWGAAGGSGGGAIRVQLTGTLNNGGYFYANGANGDTSNQHSYYGAGGGSGGSIWVTTGTLSGGGRFEAIGGSGGGGHNSYRGGAGGGGRVVVEYNTMVSFTDRKFSSVQGGYGYGGAYAESGTLAFLDRDDNDLFIVEGWRWQTSDGAHSYRNLSIEDSTRDSTAQVLHDGNALVVGATGTVSMDSSSTWNMPSSATITAGNLTMESSAAINAGTLILATSGSSLMVTANITASSALELRGGSWSMNSSARMTSPDVFFNDTANILLNNSSTVVGNVRGTTANLTLSLSNTSLNASGYGFPRDQGPGAGYLNNTSYSSGSGASHGGVGVTAYNQGNVRAYYGRGLTPDQKGSGGGSSWGANGGDGGGLISLTITGTLLNNGYFYANGASGATSNQHSYYGSGGGSGGSIEVKTGALNGSGYFQATGGDGGGGHNSYRGGSGSGGRVAVYYDSRNFTNIASSSVAGGTGYGGALAGVGTLVFVDRNTNKTSTLDDKLHAFGGWRWQANDGEHRHELFEAHNSTQISGPDSDGQVFNFSDGYRMLYNSKWRPNTHDTALTAANLRLDSLADVQAGASSLTLNVSSTIQMDATSFLDATTLSVTGTSQATLLSTASIRGQRVNWTGRDLNMSSSATFNVTGRGNAQNVGAGRGIANGSAYTSGSGAGHGGLGQAAYGTSGFGGIHGLTKAPVELGSGGGSSWGASAGSGGGAIRVQLSGVLTQNGTFYANGDDGATSNQHSYYGSGGGSGGSIWITTATLAGAGRFEAIGGSGGGGHNSYRGGGGSGGRVLVEFNSSSDFTNRKFSSVLGGYGYGGAYAESGTLAFLDRDDNDLFIVEGWRWQTSDGAHSYRNLSIEDSTRDTTALVVDDSGSLVINVVQTLTMDAAAVWNLTAGTSTLNMNRLSMSTSTIRSSNTVILNIAEQADLLSTSVIDVAALELRGGGSMVMNSSSRLISNDMFFNGFGTMDLTNSSYLQGNIRGDVDNLMLRLSNTYISANSYGFPRDQGPGAGYLNNTSYSSGSGGSHGGRGNDAYNQGNTRVYYGDPSNPTLKGSGGGSSWGANGGAGGGVVNLTIDGEFLMNGYAHANGANGDTSNQHSYYGAGGGSGGTLHFRTNLLRGAGTFQATGGSGGGGHNSYRGGAGGGGRIFVVFNDNTGFTAPQSSSVSGNSGHSGTSERGTLAFVGRGADRVSRTDDSYFVYDGWRWEQADNGGVHAHANFAAYNSALIAGPDSNAQTLSFSGEYRMRPSAAWRPNTHNTALTAGNFFLESSANIHSGNVNLALGISGTFTMATGSSINSKNVTVTGTSDARLDGTAVVYSDNIQWTGRNLDLNSTTAQFNVDGRGFAQNAGPGAGYANGSAYSSGTGASHGGVGQVAYNTGSVRPFNDSSLRPTLAGSGGGSSWGAGAGGGGGIIRVQLTGFLDIEGYFYANGADGATSNQHSYYGAGGGSGGSIWVTTDRLTGSGRFYAFGGVGGGGHNSYRGGGGGGGRIFVEYNDPTGFSNPQLSGVVGGYGYGGAYADNGTIGFFEQDVQDLWVVEGWRWQQADGPFTYRNLKVTDSIHDTSAWVRDDGNATRVDVGVLLDMDPAALWQSTASLTDIRTQRLAMNSSRITGPALSLTVSGNSTLLTGSQIDGPSVRLSGAGGWSIDGGSRLISDDMRFAQTGPVELRTSSYLQGNIQGNVRDLKLYDATVYVRADGYGFAQNTGAGAGNPNGSSYSSGSGASYGGVGTTAYNNGTVRPFHGDLMAPTAKGSGGGSSWGAAAGTGGGFINLVVANELLNNGYVQANATDGATSNQHSYYGAGGGSGGSINIDTNRLSGYGFFVANGGAGGGGHNSYRGGGGGGGRIMVQYNDDSTRTRKERMNVTAGYGYGGAYAQKGTAAYYDKDDRHLQVYDGWRWEQASRPFQFDLLSAYISTVITTEGPAMEVNVNGMCHIQTSVDFDTQSSDLNLTCGDIQMDSASRLEGGGRTTTVLSTGAVTLNGSAFMRSRTLALLGSANITLNSTSALHGNLNLAGRRMTVTTSAQLNAAGYGYGQNDGPGAGFANGSSYSSGSGASHGGVGRPAYNTGSVRPVYGDVQAPRTAGSGGGSSWGAGAGAGGGSITINMTEALRHDGQIYAHAGDGDTSNQHSYYGAGGGAGGAVFLETNGFAGIGRIYARGGTGGGGHNSYRGGGGGGGRVATCVLVAGFNGAVDLLGGYGYGGSNAQTGTFFNACTPVLPEAAVVASSGSQMPLAGTFAPNTTGVVVAQFRIREITNRNGVTINALRVNAAGSGNDATHISAVRVVHDVDGNGLVDDGERLLGQGRFNADNGSLSLSNLGLTVPRGGNTNIVVVYDFAAVIANNVTFQARLSDHTSLTLVTQGTDHPVPLYGSPVNGNSHRVYQTPPPNVASLSPSTVSQGVDSFITLHGNYFQNATAVRLSDIDNTALTLLSIYDNGTRMGVRVPSTVPVGRYHVRVTTQYGTNATSGVQLTIQASCNTGLLGICGAGTDSGQGCIPRILPGTRSEVCGNGVDENCDGQDLDCRFVDGDGDGFSPADGDCNDGDRNIFPREGLGCSAARDDLDIDGVSRAVSVYSPLDDEGDVSWTQNVGASWYQAAADTLVDSAAVFEAEGAFAEVPDSVFLQPIGDQLTVGAWINIDEVPTSGNPMIFFRGPSGGESYAVWYDAVHRCYVVVIQTTTGRHMARFVRPIVARTWIHVGATYDGAQLTLYLDGQPVANTACSGNLVHGTSVMRVGGGQVGYQTFRGRIDEVVLFGRVVSRTDILDMVRLNRLHQRKAWGNNGPVVRFSYDFGAREHDGKLPGTFRGACRISGRSSLATFPQFCSVVGTSTGFDIWDEPTGKLWARFWTQGRIANSGIKLDSVDYVTAAAGRVYLGSHTGNGGMIVLDFKSDKVEHWSTSGVATYNGGIGTINLGRNFGQVDGNALRLPTNTVRRLRGWTRGGIQAHVGVACDEGAWVIEGDSQPQFAAMYMPRHDNVNANARSVLRLLSGCGVHRVGDYFYFGMAHADDHRLDIVAGTPYRFQGVDRRSFESTVQSTMVPSSWHTVYGRSTNSVWSNFVTANVNWGAVRDLAIIPNRSRNPNAQGGDDHIIAMATPEGIVLLDQGDSDGDTAPSTMILKGEDNGVSDATTKYVLHSNVNDCSAIGMRGNEMFVGTNGAGVTRLNFSDQGDFEQLEVYTTTSGVNLPSNNITAVSCGKNALISTDAGVASIRFPEPGPCTVEGAQGACAVGRQYLVNGSLSCVQTIEPTGEVCDNVDNDCDGTPDEHPEVGSICDRQEPFIEQGAAITVNSVDCDGAVVGLPIPVVHDNNDPTPSLTNNAPARFPFGRTTVLWEARDRDGNVSSMQQVVTVNFDGQPAISAPANVTREASSPLGTPVSLGTPSGTICVPGGVTFTSNAPARFPVGQTVVVWTGQGLQGRPATASQTVTITDTTPPTINAGDDQAVDLQSDVRLNNYVVSDNASLVSNIAVTHNAPQTFPEQEFVTVTFTARDEAGNTATDSVRILVRFRSLPPPTLTILNPSTAWHNPPVTMQAEVSDTGCTVLPTVSVNSIDLTANVTNLGGGRYRVETSRVSDGIHTLTMTVTSGCSGRSSNATRVFGVDSGGLQVIYSQLNQQGVDPGDSTTWPSLSDKALVGADILLRDDRSGLATCRAEVIDVEGNEEDAIVLDEQTFRQRSGEPSTGIRATGGNFCNNDDHCQDGRLLLRTFEATRLQLRITVTDVAGNTHIARYFFRSLGLREAIVAWAEAIAATTTDNGQAQAALDAAQQKLTGSLVSFDADYFGSVWLALEDAEALVRNARVFDGNIDLASEALLVARLAADFAADLTSQARNEGGQQRVPASFDESDARIERCRALVEAESPGDAMLELSNAFFWAEDGRFDMVINVELQTRFERAVEILDRLLGQMQQYVDEEAGLPGQSVVEEVLVDLNRLQDYQRTIVLRGDTFPSDAEHMASLMNLTNTAERLKAAEEQPVWVRNWQYGLTQLVWLFANRATLNASTWIGAQHTLLGDARARLATANAHREAKEADDFMQLLIESRCMVIGVYNFTYPSSKVEVPQACCELLREYKERESRIEVPQQCLGAVDVRMENNTFSRTTINVRVGQTVRWINRDGAPHTVTSGVPGAPTRSPLNSGNIAPNAVFSRTFTQAGTFNFFCEHHPDTMAGRVVVTE